MYRFKTRPWAGGCWIQSQLSQGKGSVEPFPILSHKAISLVSQSVLRIVLVCKTAVRSLRTGQVRHGCEWYLMLRRHQKKQQSRLIFEGGYFNPCHAGTLSPPNSTANWQPPLWAAVKVIGLDSRNHFDRSAGQRFGSGRTAAAEQDAMGCFYHKPLVRSDEIRCLFAILTRKH